MNRVVSKSTLKKEFAWPDTMLKRLDKVICHKNGIALYDWDTALRIQKSDNFSLAQRNRERNRERGKKAAQSARRNLIVAVVGEGAQLKNCVPLIELRQKAEAHFDRLNHTKSASWQTKSVNYLRHQETSYNLRLAQLTKKRGSYSKESKDIAASVVREMVYNAISTAYPELAKECKRQLSFRIRNQNIYDKFHIPVAGVIREIRNLSK